jgi:ketosteroid isomerase-like protein
MTALDTSLEARLQRLEDERAIWQLFMEYRRALDTRDWAAYSQLFADEGEWLGNLGRAKGPAAIKELLENVPPGEFFDPGKGADFHLIANPEIEVDGDRATSTSTWCFITRQEPEEPHLAMIGHYVDTLVRDGDRWKFMRREAYSDIPLTEFDTS